MENEAVFRSQGTRFDELYLYSEVLLHELEIPISYDYVEESTP
jgi:hypothetical protein